MANQEEEDPFAVFGDSDSDDDAASPIEGTAESEVHRITRSLVKTADVRTNFDQTAASQPAALKETSRTNAATKEEVARFELNVQLNPIDLPWSPPLYVGPMKVVSLTEFGGGRGCVAERDLSPGTLLLVEEPLASWSVEDNSLDLTTIHNLLERPNAQQIVHDLEHFHPTRQAIDDDDEVDSDQEQVEGMMKTMRLQYGEGSELKNAVRLAAEKKIHNSDGAALSETDLLRLLLSLRYNGLETGIYRYAAMLNHSDQPNCVKFLPTKEQKYSEVRTTRAVCAGEPLTISYLPRIMSHASRRKHLWEQHRFDIGVGLSRQLRAMEVIGRRLPPSALNRWDDTSTTHRIELAVAELEGMYGEAAEEFQSSTPEFFEKGKALEQAALELILEAKRQLQNDKHLLLLPCLRLHIDCCDLVQRHPVLRLADRIKLLGRLVATAQSLLVMQKLYHGPDHFDIARTELDMAQAIEELLSRSSKHLIALKLEGLNSISAWSSLASQLRKDYNRITALYPRDAEQYITNNI